MAKTKLGPTTNLLPLPAFLVGAKTKDGKANFCAIAWGGVVNSEPPMVGMAIRKSRFTHECIKRTGTFSVVVPSAKQATETDYCGIVSGRKEDKTAKCGFTIFYGDLETAPMIEESPVGLECKVEKIVELPSHDLIIGEVKQTHVDERLAKSGKLDPREADPLVFMGPYYARVEGDLGRAFGIGAKLRGVER